MKFIPRRALSLPISIIASFALVVSLAPAASASTQPTTTTRVASSTASHTTSSNAHSVNGVSIRSNVTVLAFVQANGASAAQKKGKRVKLSKRMKLRTSYINTAGKEVWHDKTYPKGYTLIWGKDGWWHDPACWNKVAYRRPAPKKNVIKGAVKIVKKFSFKAVSTSNTAGNATALATAKCETAGNSAFATGYGRGAYSAAASAVGTGTTWASARAAASTNAGTALKKAMRISLSANVKTYVKMRVETQATGQASADATAKVECKDAPPPVIVNPPTLTVDAVPCVKPGETGLMKGRAQHSNTGSYTLSIKVGAQQVARGTVSANQELPFEGNFPLGTYMVTATLEGTGKSVSVPVTVTACPPPADNPPIVNPKGGVAHVTIEGDVYLYYEAFDPDGDFVDVSIEVAPEDRHIGHLGEINREWPTRWDGTPCPSGVQCYRATFWGDSAGSATVVLKGRARGLDATPKPFEVVVRPHPDTV